MNGEESRYGPGRWYSISAKAQHAARFEQDTSGIEFGFYRV